MSCGIGCWKQFQFTPLREGRQGAKAEGVMSFGISIHAPARGATCLQSGRMSQDQLISIHAPARGATYEKLGGDGFVHGISIHAPARGATCSLPHCAFGRNFNSRPCERGDLRLSYQNATPGEFQFTPLREGRRAGTRCPGCADSFQFTPLREGRPQ